MADRAASARLVMDVRELGVEGGRLRCRAVHLDPGSFRRARRVREVLARAGAGAAGGRSADPDPRQREEPALPASALGEPARVRAVPAWATRRERAASIEISARRACRWSGGVAAAQPARDLDDVVSGRAPAPGPWCRWRRRGFVEGIRPAGAASDALADGVLRGGGGAEASRLAPAPALRPPRPSPSACPIAWPVTSMPGMGVGAGPCGNPRRPPSRISAAPLCPPQGEGPGQALRLRSRCHREARARAPRRSRS